MTTPGEAAISERDALARAIRDNPSDPATLNAAAVNLRADWPGSDEALASDALLSGLLVGTPACPVWLERRLTDLRRRLLTEGGGPARLLASLAIQGALNEFAWAWRPTEEARVEALARRIDELTPSEAMLLASYRPLAGIPGADALMQRGWTGPVLEVLDEQIAAVRKEQALQARIPTLTPIRQGVSEEVRGQYEASPYPRWRKVMSVPAQASIFGWRVPDRPNVLIAGCGTGQHAIHAGQRYAGARLLGVDLSRASLGYGMRKAREAGIGNIAFAQADLLELAVTGFEFEIIECSGVLHHMDDPFEGARALIGRLRPGGLIKISLYSAKAREVLKPAKALAKHYTPETIRQLREAIATAPEGDPVRGCTRFTDFFATSSCRDLLMHVQEHELTIPDLKRMLAENQLAFRGFAIDPEVTAAYRVMFPDDPAAIDLDRWDAFEQANPQTFGRMYQLWAVKTG